MDGAATFAGIGSSGNIENTRYRTMQSNNSQESPFKGEWAKFWAVLFRPLIIFPTLLTIVLLFVANTGSSPDKNFAILLNVLASISLALAGGFLTDSYKSLTGDQILIKKGLSAVRNLSLCRQKINSISKRANEASNGEMTNLLSMLEKDIANATQEWNDIIPGVTDNIEATYVLLKEKEEELRIAQGEREKLKELQAGAEQKEKLIEDQNRKITGLLQQIGKLEIKTSSPLFGASTLADKDFLNDRIPEAAKRARCATCGNQLPLNHYTIYQLTHDHKMECMECEQRRLLQAPKQPG